LDHCNEKLLRKAGITLSHVASTDLIYHSVNEIEDWKSDQFKTDEGIKKINPVLKIFVFTVYLFVADYRIF